MDKKFWILIISLFLIFGGLYYYIVNYTPKIPTAEEKLLQRMDFLVVKVDSIRRANDSIKVIIDTTEIEIKHVYNEYIQIRDHIVAQSPDSDCVFFSEYLSKNSQRYLDTINFRAVETY